MSEGYKVTELGDIPENWELKKFKDETELLTCGVAATPEYVDSNLGIPFLSAQNVKDGRVVLDKYSFISKSFHDELTKNNKPRKGDILYSRVGAKFGEAGVVEHAFEFSIYVSLTLIRVKPTSSNYFVKHLLNSEYVKNKARQSVFQGAGVPNLNVKVVREFVLPFPPLPEQQKIASILSTVDEKIEIIDAQISQTQQLKKGLMQQLLSKGIGHTKFKSSELGDIPESWEVVKVKSIAKLQGGFAFKSNDASEDGVRWLKIANVGLGNVVWNDVSFLPIRFTDEYKDFLLYAGDIVIAMTRPLLGNMLKISKISEGDEGALLNQRVGRVLVKANADKEFVFQTINSDRFLSQLKKEILGSDPPNISSNTFEGLILALPPLHEQERIALILKEIDNKLQSLQSRKETYQQLKKGLMQQLLTGKIRVSTSQNEPALA